MPEEEGKYWIKPGVNVTLKDAEGVRMCVDKVLTKTNAEGRKFTDGVLCHWLDEHGGYQKGKFLTTELKPFNN